MKIKLFLLLALPAFCVSVSADTVEISGVMDVFFGTSTLSSGGGPASQTTAVTAETQLGSGVPGDLLASVLAGLGPGIVNQVLTDPTVTSVVPSFVLTALPGLESADGLGSGVPGSSLPALLNLLETQSTPFVVASDTGPQNFLDPSAVFTYEDTFGPFASHPGTTYVVDVNVNFFQDNLQLVATPEPSSLALALTLLLGAFLSFRRTNHASRAATPAKLVPRGSGVAATSVN